MNFLSITSRSLLFVFVALFLYSCNEKEVIQPGGSFSPDTETVNEVRKVFAQTLARALEDAKLRLHIHERMRRAYETNYEMVYLAEKNQIVHSQKTLADILTSYADQEILDKYGDRFFYELTNLTPLISIAMPDGLPDANILAWNVDLIPQVAAVYDKSDVSFDIFREGTQVLSVLTTKENKDDDVNTPTLSVWDAESHYLVRADGTTYGGTHIDDHMPVIPSEAKYDNLLQAALNELQLYFVTFDQFYLVSHDALLAMYIDCLNGLGGGTNPPGGCTEPIERDCNTSDEVLFRFQINNQGVFDNIKNQTFENHFVFHADIARARRNNLDLPEAITLKYVSPVLRKHDILENCNFFGRNCSPKWVNANFRIGPDWDISSFSDAFGVDWAEVDNGQTTRSFSLRLGVKFKILGQEINLGDLTIGFTRVGSQIVSLGRQMVYYEDPVSLTNDTGSISFELE